MISVNLRSQSPAVKPILLAFALSVSSIGGAQSPQATTPSAKVNVKAYSEPVSTRQIYLTASIPGSELVTIRVQEGAMAKIISTSQHAGFALIPIVNSADPNAVTFKVFALTVDQNGNERVYEKGSVTGIPGEEKTLEAVQDLRFTLKSIN